MSAQRVEALRALIAYNLPVEPALAVLASCGWDCENPLVELTRGDLLNVLDRYSLGVLTAAQLTDWADLLECRDDVLLPRGSPDLSEMIFRLANPNLAGPIDTALVERFRNELFGSAGGV